MRVCQFRHFGKSDWAAIRRITAGRTPNSFYPIARTRAPDPASNIAIARSIHLSETSSANKSKQAEVTHLRHLAHDLSNCLETILQAAYLLDRLKLDEQAKKWTALINTAAQDATRLNRQIREILKSQS